MSRYIMLGELLLRLKAPGLERLLQSAAFEATIGGAEANVAVSLAQFGLDAGFVTALPDNPLADAAVAELRRHGVDVAAIVRTGERMGLYYLEAGSGHRPSRVTYDRAGSSMAGVAVDAFDWQTLFSDAGWFHITGITPALSETAAALSLAACREARRRGLTVSCDLNHRALLWQYGKPASEVMPTLIREADIVIAGREDCQKSLGIELEMPTGDALDLAHFESLSSAVLDAYPNLKLIAITLRDSVSAEQQRWSACLHDRTAFLTSRRYDLTAIVDRVGAGDSFAAGLIYGLGHCADSHAALEFATAASCLKHSISGDFNRVSVTEVERLLRGDGTGRVQR